MYENLSLLVEHHKADLEREARAARLAHDALAEKRKNEKARATLVALLGQVIHIR